LADSCIRADPDKTHRVAVDSWSEARIVSHLKVPGSPDPRGGMHHYRSADARPEAA
jgi:hypothetical protein